ncbi:MAG: DUF4838 domain-containing protein [Ruminococcaceae bacterium]|nr:DUF4838 domain-containing protein [Oscillospiraceae bacterium]
MILFKSRHITGGIKMAAYGKAILSLIEVILFILGIFPVDTNINYGGNDYIAPAITTPMYIVADGESDFSIVTAENADECIMTAADELQTYIEKISGAELQIITENQLENGEKAIVLGETELEKEITEVNRAAIGADGFLLYSDGNYLLVAGGDSRGTLYGVYTLLEDYFGVRWFTPELEVVPESKDIVIDGKLNKIVQPSFAIRRNDIGGTNDAYRARTKMNVSFHYEMPEYGGALTYVLWDVTFDRLVPDSLFAEHPEYFAQLPDGTRTTDHVCVSHPEVLTVAVENARKAILECEKDSKYIHIGQKDNSNYCQCENCTALYEKYGSISAPTIIFTNAFADALDDEFPDFTFTFYAYLETERPPKDLSLKCNPNVVPVLCGLHHACRSHLLTECGAQDGDESFLNLYGDNEPAIAQDFADWTKIADRTFIYDYTINFLNTAQFFSNLETMQPTMKYMHDIGITGYVYNCGDGHYAAFNDLRNYLLRKIQWDVDCDVEYHMTDFIKAYYGEAAAPYIKEILDIQTAQTKATAHAFDFDWHYQAGFYAPLNALRLEILWQKALKADITEEQLFNVEVDNLSWEYFKANQFIGKYFFLNPFRMQANEWLYDEFKAHGMDRVSSFGIIPQDKSTVDFIQRPFNWG